MILIVKISLLVILLLGLLRLKVDLALAVLAVTILTILLFGVPLALSLGTAWQTLGAASTWEMLAVIVLVQVIGAIQKSRRMFDHLILALNAVLRDKRLVAIVSPMVIGFLPMPGGALFSAPLVETSTREMKLKPAFNAFLNYWFRHDWELIWPLYAGLLMFQTMAQIPMRRIVLFQLPFSLLHIATGLAVAFWVFRRQGIRRVGPEATSAKKHELLRSFFAGTWPLWVIILAFFFLGLPLHWTVVGVTLLLALLERVRPREALGFLTAATVVRSVLMILAVLVFQRIIEISGAFAPLAHIQVPLELIVLIIFFVSFTLGFLTGVNTAYIAIAFPVLLPLIQTLPNYFYLALYIYVIGFAGILLSPLHLCLVLTNEHFRAPALGVYRYMALPVLAMILLATALVLIL